MPSRNVPKTDQIQHSITYQQSKKTFESKFRLHFPRKGNRASEKIVQAINYVLEGNPSAETSVSGMV